MGPAAPADASNQALSDGELMRRMSAGSTVAFGDFYERHSARALKVARSICRNSGAAEEAVQDAFEGIWKSRATYRADRGPAVAWAMSIVRYRAIAISSRRDAPPARDDCLGAAERASPRDQLVDDAITRGEAEHLREVLKRIPPVQREVITLAFYGQMSHTEIARHLGLPAGTVKGRMRLGLEKLRAGFKRTA